MRFIKPNIKLYKQAGSREILGSQLNSLESFGCRGLCGRRKFQANLSHENIASVYDFGFTLKAMVI